MSQTKDGTKDEFHFLYEMEETELQELRKFLDPEIDLSSLKGFDIILDKLNHILDNK